MGMRPAHKKFSLGFFEIRCTHFCIVWAIDKNYDKTQDKKFSYD